VKAKRAPAKKKPSKSGRRPARGGARTPAGSASQSYKVFAEFTEGAPATGGTPTPLPPPIIGDGPHAIVPPARVIRRIKVTKDENGDIRLEVLLD
jgi:hypothetical protein